MCHSRSWTYLNNTSFQQTLALGSHNKVMCFTTIINEVLEVNVVLISQMSKELEMDQSNVLINVKRGVLTGLL